jgi:ABC-type Fe3+ transport system substrate-binding protein
MSSTIETKKSNELQCNAETEGKISNTSTEKLNFLGFTYCPLKPAFKEHFEDVLTKYRQDDHDKNFSYYVPTGCGGPNPFDDIQKAQTIDDLPDVIVAAGFRDFFRRDFYERFIVSKQFKAVPMGDADEVFTSAGIPDPDGIFTVYSISASVMLIDLRKLGGAPVPQRWSDLIDPIYKNNITIGASHGDLNDDVMLFFYKDFGDEGLGKFAENVKHAMHPSQMAKKAGTANPDGTAIYILPWMFAKACPRVETTKLIWPQDGAITTPLFVLVKDGFYDKYRPFVDFVTGSEYGQKSADTYYPVLNPNVTNKLPTEASFNWLGWNYIKANSIDSLKENALGVFMENWSGEMEAL